MKDLKVKLYALLLTLIFCNVIAIKAKAQTTNPATPADLTVFINKAYSYNLNEIDNGNMALKKAADGGVKSFGSQVAADHLQLNEQLKTLAKNERLKKPRIDTAIQVKSKTLEQSKGPEFDSQFLDINIKTDQEVITLYQNALASFTDPQVLTFVKKNLPILNDHLKDAKGLAKQLNVSKH